MVSLIAIVPDSECRMPTLIVSSASAYPVIANTAAEAKTLLSQPLRDIPIRASSLHYLRLDAMAAWARRCGCYILEDDSDGEFRFEGSPMKAIAATAPDCTIYLGAFSRTLGACSTAAARGWRRRRSPK
jgi:hypothetical protein